MTADVAMFTPRVLGPLLVASLVGCQPTEAEVGDDEHRLILGISAFDDDTDNGVLNLQARGGKFVEIGVSGGLLRDERGELAARHCFEVREDGVRRLPFSLDGEHGLLTAVLLEDGAITTTDGTPGSTCGSNAGAPLVSACCALPTECGCADPDEEVGSDGSATGRATTTTTTDSTGSMSTTGSTGTTGDVETGMTTSSTGGTATGGLG